MKKISMVLMAAAMVMFVACGGKKADNEGETVVEEVTVTEAEAPVAASSATVDKYLSLVEEAIPLMEKVQKGDAEAVQKYTKIAEEMATLASSADLQNELASSPEVARRFQDAMQKLAATSGIQ